MLYVYAPNNTPQQIDGAWCLSDAQMGAWYNQQNPNGTIRTDDISGFSLPDIYPVVATTPPAYSPDAQTAQQTAPTLANSVWTQQWAVSTLPITLAEQQNIVINKIKAERDRRWYGGCAQVAGNWYGSDATEVGKYDTMLLAAVVAGAPSGTVLVQNWRCLNVPVMVDLTPALLGSILSAGMTAQVAIDNYSKQLIATVEASVTPWTVDIVTGWPLIYGE